MEPQGMLAWDVDEPRAPRPQEGASAAEAPLAGLPGGEDAGAGRPARLAPRTGSNKCRVDAGGVAPRSNSNKISSNSPRADSRGSAASVQLQGAGLAWGPASLTPRTTAGGASTAASPQITPRQAGPALADVKRELLGPEMRRLIREELEGVLLYSERGPSRTDGGGGDGLTSRPMARHREQTLDQKEENPTMCDVHFDVSDLYAVGDSRADLSLEEMEASAMEEMEATSGPERRAVVKMKTFTKEHLPLHVEKGGISMLDVTVKATESMWDRVMLKVQARLNVLGTVDPPYRSDPLSRVCDSLAFELAVHAIILVNIGFMAVEADYLIKSSPSDSDSIWEILHVAEIIFIAFYALEFVVKFARCRWTYFYGRGYGWNWIDFLVLIFSIPVLFQFDHGLEALPAKIIRILRLSRALRVLQLVTIFKKLRALLKSLTASISTLACSAAMLVVFFFMFSLFFVMRVGQTLSMPSADVTAKERQDLLTSWGGVMTGMLTLLKACTGGRDWSEEYDILLATGWPTQMIFVLFIAFSQMALLNIILGMFVDQAMKSMAGDKLELAYQHFEEQKEFRKTAHELLCRVGPDDENRISLAQWKTSPNKRHLYSYLDLHGFQPNEVDQFFELLSKASPEAQVEVGHFVNACIRMKGGASSFSVYEVLMAISEIESQLLKMQSQLRDAPAPGAANGDAAPPRRYSAST